MSEETIKDFADLINSYERLAREEGRRQERERILKLMETRWGTVKRNITDKIVVTYGEWLKLKEKIQEGRE
jgi:hypothetical protein